MIKILTVVGARPQFIKAAVISRLIRSEEYSGSFQETLLHTGQHYDANMSDIFFREMQIPQPDIQLKAGGISHGAMTGKMLTEIESILLNIRPDAVLVYGDTNSTLAGALASAKLNIPFAHVEAGLRSYNKRMPEEQNRVVTDHLSTWLFCPTEASVANLMRENLTERVYQVGDIMLDAHNFYKNHLEQNGDSISNRINVLNEPDLARNGYALATIHRAENTDDASRLRSIIEALNALPNHTILPLHPRTRRKLEESRISTGSQVHLIEPVSYTEMMYLELNASYIITDSGGVQKEAYFAQKPCITLREETEWIETVQSGWNRLVGFEKSKIIEAITTLKTPENHPMFYGEGDSGRKILEILDKDRC